MRERIVGQANSMRNTGEENQLARVIGGRGSKRLLQSRRANREGTLRHMVGQHIRKRKLCVVDDLGNTIFQEQA